MTLTRRQFLLSMAVAAPAPVRVALIVPRTAQHAVSGATVGAEEARHTAGLFQRRFDLEVMTVWNPAEAAAAARRATSAGSYAIVGGMSEVLSDAIAKSSGVPFLEIRALSEAGRQTSDGRYRLTPPAARLSPETVVWHHALRRYGAGELNERFQKKAGTQMNSDSWTAWLAMKLIVEAALRESDIASIRVDGHKGVPLRFDRDRVLQQPLYRLATKGGKETVVDE